MVKDNKINDFCVNLASKNPTPGGGSVAAVQGALGAGLIAMVADITLNSLKYKNFWEINKSVLNSSIYIKNKFLELAQKDIDEYSKMKNIYSMKNNTKEEQTIRTEKLQQTLKNCAMPPFECIRLSNKAINLITDILDCSSKLAQSDLGCAATLLKSCIQNSWLNLRANTKYIKDLSFVKKYEADAKSLIETTTEKSNLIYLRCNN